MRERSYRSMQTGTKNAIKKRKNGAMPTYRERFGKALVTLTDAVTGKR